MIRPAAALMLLACAALSGCGTFSDAMCGPANDHVFYRGVRFDILAAQEGGAHALMAADIPLSAIADTLLLPWAVQYAMEHRESPTSRKSNVKPPDAPGLNLSITNTTFNFYVPPFSKTDRDSANGS